VSASHVLVAEGSDGLRRAFCASLEAEGHHVESAATSGAIATTWARGTPDVVVLDSGLVDDALRRLVDRWTGQGWSGALILLGKVRGGPLPGATVLARPVVIQELLSAIKESLGGDEAPLQLLPLRGRIADLEHREVRADDGSTARLTAREVEFLRYLARSPGRTISREELLEKVWGYRLGALSRSRSVDKMLTRLRPKLGDPAGAPHHIFSVYGGGYRFVPLEEETPDPAVAVEPAEPAQMPGTLPVLDSEFVGREDDLADLADDLATGARLITVLGPGGVGKTRLVLQQATALREHGGPAGGVWFCDLTEARDLDALLAAVADVLELDLAAATGADRPLTVIGEALAEAGDVLLVLDNLEQVAAAAAGAVTAWLKAAPRARFLATSREPLRLHDERCFELDGLPPDDAVALFARRAAGVRRGFELTDAGRTAAAGIVQRLDGLPLAIELAAARVQALSPEKILDRLERNFDTILASRERGRAARQTTLVGAIEWSWDLLTGWEQAALAQCSVFRGGFFLEAAEAVLDLSAFPDAPPELDVVEELVRKSLVRRQEVAPLGEIRFRLYEMIRSYAGRKLEGMASAEGVVRRAQAYFLALGDELGNEVLVRSSPRSLRLLALEQDNLLAVLRRARAANRRAAVQAALALDRLLTARGPRSTHDRLLDDAVQLASTLGPEWRARVRHARGEAKRNRGDLEGAESDLLLALALAQESGQKPLLGQVSLSLGNLRFRQGRGEEATEHYRRSLECARSAGNRGEEAFALGRLGSALQLVGQVPEAMEHYRDALRVSREVGDQAQLFAGSLIVLDLDRVGSRLDVDVKAPLPSGALGYASFFQLFGAALPVGRVREAQRALEKALDFAREAGDRLGEAALTASLGLSQLDAEATEGAPALERAECAFRDALAVIEEVGNPASEASILGNLGRLHHLAGRLDEAEASLTEAAELARRIGARRLEAWLFSLLGAVLADLGRSEEARQTLGRGHQLAVETNDVLAMGVNLVARGHLVLAAGGGDVDPIATLAGTPIPGSEETPRRLAVSSVDMRLAIRALELARSR
jgi:predicted ATPase/DNA-binding response OmpR family regulator/Flp pilus assembly protein TadD